MKFYEKESFAFNGATKIIYHKITITLHHYLQTYIPIPNKNQLFFFIKKKTLKLY